ncbi:30S ribosomal protein S4e [Candidatus Woesearchaeota archaeon]|nr:30S ribosomal protein S4e [Candidatus Woesearchaeota archaeon]
MGSIGEKHLSRLAVPKTWQIKRKGIKWISRPLPGTHSIDRSMPLSLIFRHLLNYTRTNKEVKYILNNQEIFVDGIRRKNPRFAIGVMDVLTVPKLDQYFRVLLNRKGKLRLLPIQEKEANIKLCRIKNKTPINKKIQLNLGDGRNILVEKDEYKTRDTLVIEIPSQKIKELLKLEKGNLVYLTGGKHVGEVGTIEDVKKNKLFYKRDKKLFETDIKFAFVIGKKAPLISLSEVKK